MSADTRDSPAKAPRRARGMHLPVAVLTLVALALRLVQLATPTLRWDEGWSLGLASLPWADLWRVATEESHPPLYVALLKLWIPLGRSATILRLPSVLAGVLAVPLTYDVARRGWRDEAIAVAAAAAMVVWPLHVYYSQVARMYALVVLPVLGAAGCALRWEDRPSPTNAVGLALNTLIALWINYYALWPLAVVWLCALTAPRGRRRFLGLAGAMGLVVMGYVPWLLAAASNLQARTGLQEASPGPLIDALRYLRPTLDGMLYSYDAPLHPALIVLPILVAGLAVSRVARREAQVVMLAAAAVAVSLAGMTLGAHLTRWFAPRYMVVAAPFLAMLLGWALVRLFRRSRTVAALALVAVALVYWPAATGSVYAKMLEVVDPIDPAADHAYLATRALSGDGIYFNVLAKAGWYEHHRRPGDAPWSYAMRWDPVIEPLERIQGRVEAVSPPPARLWFVLYKGSYGPNAPLKEWLDGAFYPAGETWLEDTLIAAYVRPRDAADAGWTERAVGERFGGGLELASLRWASAGSDAMALELEWSGEPSGSVPLKVFVHLADETGRPLAQHDTSYSAGMQRHGLLLPADRPGALYLHVGLYHANTGQRVGLPDGRDAVALGRLPL